MRKRFDLSRSLRRIAVTTDYRGINDDILTFAFIGSDQSILHQVFSTFSGKGLFDAYHIDLEHACEYQLGKSYWRDVVYIENPNTDFCSVEDLLAMVINRLQSVCKCTVKKLHLDTFLNS